MAPRTGQVQNCELAENQKGSWGKRGLEWFSRLCASELI